MTIGGEEAGGMLEQRLGLVAAALLPAEERQGAAVEGALHAVGEAARRHGEQGFGGLRPAFEPARVGSEAVGAGQRRRGFFLAAPKQLANRAARHLRAPPALAPFLR